MATADDLLPPAVSPRSRLYSLAPIGIGTPDVESLESYTIRLAWLHGVTPGFLMTREIARLIDPIGAESVGVQEVPFGNHTINGAGMGAERWVNALEQLTLRSDLTLLTLRPWREAFPKTGLNRRSKAWCPHCFDEDTEPYDRLLWAVGVVTACPKHQVFLTEACPHCSSKLPIRAYTARPGFCVRCSLSLAQPFTGVPSKVADYDSLRRAIRNAAQVGALLAVADHHNIPRAARIFTGLPALRRLCKLQGVLLNWRRHKRIKKRRDADSLFPAECFAWKPQRTSLESLLDICENAGVSLFDFMTSPVETLKVCPKQLPPRTKRKPAVADPEVFLPKLRRIVESNNNPPPPLISVSRAINVRVWTLRQFAPELCRTVVERYRIHIRSVARDRRQRLRDEVWEAASRLKEAGSPLREGLVAKALTQPGAMRDPVARQALRDFTAQEVS